MTTKEHILTEIRSRGVGSAFTAKDFAVTAPRGTIDVTLARLAEDGVIRRISRGLYDFPRQSEILDQAASPDIDQAAQAIARKHRWTIAPDGATAANTLGLSQQVPARITYLSDGPTRQFTIGGGRISFRHANPKDLKMRHYSSRLLAQALRFLGKENIDSTVIDRLRRIVPAEDSSNFCKDAQYSTDWILMVARRIDREQPDE